MITLTLPWPSTDLSPNGRVHFQVRARASRKAKNEAWGITKAAMGPLRIVYGSWRGPISVQYTFHARQDRGRDDDNFIARMKPTRDGIAMALGVNDVEFTTLPVIWGTKRSGLVEVTLNPALVSIPIVGRVS